MPGTSFHMPNTTALQLPGLLGLLAFLNTTVAGTTLVVFVGASAASADGRVFVAALGGGVHAIDLATGNRVWHFKLEDEVEASPLVLDGTVYLGAADAFFYALDARTGAVLYQDQRLEGLRGMYASPLAAGGYVYLIGREGTAMVIRDAAQFEVVSSNQLDDRFDASPVILGKDLFLRGHRYLYCISEG